MDYWTSGLACGLSAGVSVMGLTIDQWCVLAAIVGMSGTVTTTLTQIYYERKANKRMEARFNGIKT